VLDLVRRSRLIGAADQERAVQTGADQQLGHHCRPYRGRDPTRSLLDRQVGRRCLDDGAMVPEQLPVTGQQADAVGLGRDDL
jgi:hypothetical protein